MPTNFNLKFLYGFIVCLVAAGISFGLMFSTITSDGLSVPKDLTELASKADKPDYQVPTTIAASCTPKGQVDDETEADIKKVTQADPQSCSFKRANSLESDAWWGLLAFMLVCAVVVVLFRLMKSSKTVEITVVVGMLVAVALVSALLDDVLMRWLTDMNVVFTIFIRAFIASAVLAIGAFLAHEAHRKVTEEALKTGTIQAQANSTLWCLHICANKTKDKVYG